MEGNLNGNHLRVNNIAVSRAQNQLIGEFKVAAGDVISIRGQVMECTTFKQELKGVGDLVWIVTGRGKSSGMLEEDRWPFILVDRLF